MQNRLLEGFEIGSLRRLKSAQCADFFGECIELFDDLFCSTSDGAKF